MSPTLLHKLLYKFIAQLSLFWTENYFRHFWFVILKTSSGLSSGIAQHQEDSKSPIEGEIHASRLIHLSYLRLVMKQANHFDHTWSNSSVFLWAKYHKALTQNIGDNSAHCFLVIILVCLCHFEAKYEQDKWNHTKAKTKQWVCWKCPFASVYEVYLRQRLSVFVETMCPRRQTCCYPDLRILPLEENPLNQLLYTTEFIYSIFRSTYMWCSQCSGKFSCDIW